MLKVQVCVENWGSQLSRCTYVQWVDARVGSGPVRRPQLRLQQPLRTVTVAWVCWLWCCSWQTPAWWSEASPDQSGPLAARNSPTTCSESFYSSPEIGKKKLLLKNLENAPPFYSVLRKGMAKIRKKKFWEILNCYFLLCVTIFSGPRSLLAC